MPIKLLDRLLFAQGGACFFCNSRLPREEATVEHLDARANGGNNSSQNCVACCSEINTLLGAMSLKEKIRVLLNQKGKFICPKRAASDAVPVIQSAPPRPPATAVDTSAYLLVLAALERQGPSRPKRVKSLKNTIRSILRTREGSLTEPQLDSLLKGLQADGAVQINGTTVTYSL